MKYFIIIILSIMWPGIGHIFIKKLKLGILLILITLINFVLSFQFLSSTYFGLILSFVIHLIIIIISITNVIIEYKKSKISIEYKMIIILILIPIFLFIMEREVISHSFRFRTFKMRSSSMSNTIIEGENLIADINKNYKHSIQAGDLIIFEYLDLNFKLIYRVIALENDEIEIIDDNVYVNGIFVDEPYKYLDPKYSNSMFPNYFNEETFGFPLTKIEQNKIFVLADNRYNGNDSRYIGQIHRDFVLGKALYIYNSNNYNRIGKILK